MHKPTIEDVAKRANVSIATVSRVINRQGGVRQKTEARILAAIEELNYIPNAVARSMVKKTTNTIGIIIPDVNNPFFPTVVSGIEQKAREKGYFTFLCNTNESADTERELLTILLERSVDGLIITTADEAGDQLQTVMDAKIPVVAVDRAIKKFEVDTVLVGNVDGAYQATRHLILQGHKRIAIICGPQNTTPGYERFVGYKRALDDYGIPVVQEYVLEGDFKEESGRRLTKQLYQLPERPTAIFSSNNLMTVGCMKALYELDWKLGEEVSFIGFDDVDIATFVNPPLTVVSRPMRKLGEVAFEMLYERMTEGWDGAKRHYVLSPELKIRQSCRLK
ncbi:LacI family DNA-binding transcriptional regulator [Brevibacillus thermoruber]|uniref:LacI family DNA-binding transcriptional regulator n=1 Tax=Brevibacillus thermoruber TaxID=33942 RepID=A0A9X3TPH3_9BACL|nr:LacI family DNA-binding transcriptional regulator [Brevibacillus thermoruber]MDA5107920.1 LacI family DNA-binding transcriptional regulator [Brevibacillus thermoruber]